MGDRGPEPQSLLRLADHETSSRPSPRHPLSAHPCEPPVNRTAVRRPAAHQPPARQTASVSSHEASQAVAKGHPNGLRAEPGGEPHGRQSPRRPARIGAAAGMLALWHSSCFYCDQESRPAYAVAGKRLGRQLPVLDRGSQREICRQKKSLAANRGKGTTALPGRLAASGSLGEEPKAEKAAARRGLLGGSGGTAPQLFTMMHGMVAKFP